MKPRRPRLPRPGTVSPFESEIREMLRSRRTAAPETVPPGSPLQEIVRRTLGDLRPAEREILERRFGLG
jgi:hypothetical protein